MPRKLILIDRDKLRAAVRSLRHEYIFYMLDDAIELLPAAKLGEIAKKYVDLKQLQPDPTQEKPQDLVAEAQRFRKASLSGQYYESFNVNSKNCTEKSIGTLAWIADYHRLLKRCVIGATGSNPAEVRGTMEILFGLLDHIDECHDDVIFFADEGGSWQVGVDWDRVLPVWFKALSATAAPDDFARQIKHILSRHYAYGSDKMIKIACETATAEQRRALAKIKVGK